MIASWEDSGTRQYASRFEFEVLDEHPSGQPRWVLDVSKQLSGPTPDLRTIPGFQDSVAEAVLASYFDSPTSPSAMESVALAMLSQSESEAIDIADLSDDEKKIVVILQKVREGQQKFRSKLIDAYGACAITGTTASAVLDAAHIRAYSGPKSNIVQNGLLLRGDLHRLFDKCLLTVTTDHVVRVSPELGESAYAELDGRSIKSLPSNPREHPDQGLLQEHNDRCTWLTP